MHVAAKYGDGGTIKTLFDLKANIRAKDAEGKEPIHFATASTVGDLVEGGADIDAVDDDGRAVLHYAVAGGDLDWIEEMLSYSPDTELNDCDGKIPMNLAYGPLPRSRIDDLLGYNSIYSEGFVYDYCANHCNCCDCSDEDGYTRNRKQLLQTIRGTVLN
eukprot:GILJ01032079.1.p1 GENE.GILJ01032079.1~~GILJ01032079.1.p1  ORF type:complete len:160 (-),score=21.70 GILJ01032079.1:579-1058(-)